MRALLAFAAAALLFSSCKTTPPPQPNKPQAPASSIRVFRGDVRAGAPDRLAVNAR